MHSTVPESPRQLLADLDNMERVMLERDSKKQKSRKPLVANLSGSKTRKSVESEIADSARVTFCELNAAHTF